MKICTWVRIINHIFIVYTRDIRILIDATIQKFYFKSAVFVANTSNIGRLYINSIHISLLLVFCLNINIYKSN